MISLILRKHPDDEEVIEVITRRPVKVTGLPDREWTYVWAIVHTDLVSEDNEIKEALEHDGEVGIEITIKKDEEGE